MAKIVPKEVPEAGWHPLTPHRDYGVRVGAEDVVFFRFGQGQGMFIMVGATQDGLMVNTLDYDSGDPTVVGKIPAGAQTVIGRTAECNVKVMHAIVSRQHVEMRLEGNVLVVKDLGSTNGTYCQVGNVCFDIQEYLQNHPVESAHESTLDQVHEMFGPTLDDFLKRYSLEKKLK